MQFFPNKSEFTSQVWIKTSADLITPVAAALKLQDHSPYAFLLESVEGGAKRGRYSIIGMGAKELLIDQPLEVLRAKINSRSKSAVLPPMSAGYYGYMGYDMVRHFEKLPNKNPDELGIPDSVLLLPEILLIFDSVKDEVYIISNCDSYAQGKKKIVEILELLRANLPIPEPVSAHTEITFTANFSQAQYHAAVEKAKEYILAGDIFQVVPSRRFVADFTLPPFAFYRALRHLNPSPFLFFLKLDGFHIIGSSPEILVRVQDGKVTIRPIAGTRKRGANEAEDLALEKDLLGDAKEMAEHLMLLDLGRNDVGRVAKGGKVAVTERAFIERYSHVMHIVSNVEGELAQGFDVIDALAAGFPAGTVSGAPKIRAMEIIDEIESVQRKFYGGAAGYFSKDQMDTCITLRTALIKDSKLYLQAGGGVVADSDPEAEFQETENKARALKKAAELAKDFI
jgi:anthranilate synthase component 1